MNVGLGVLAAMLLATLGWMLIRYLLQVGTALAVNRAFGKGDLSVRALVGGAKMAGFNDTSDQLQVSHAEVERRVTERTRELQSVFATVSHEFRTPLQVILALTELTADPRIDLGSPEWRREYSETVGASAQLLLDKVNEILGLARLDAGMTEITVEPLDLAPIVAGAVGLIRALARRREIVVVDSSAPGLTVVADRTRLTEVLLNLLSNAVKYNRVGGTIEITTRAVADRAEITVRDTGAGIPPEAGDGVFQPFYQVAGQTPANGEASTGLGLAVAKRLVEAMDGSMTYRSAVGVGSTFLVWLPAAGHDL